MKKKATIKDIAQEAEITPGLIYCYFESKEAGELQQADSMLAAQLLVSPFMSFLLRRQVLHEPLALQYSPEHIAETVVDNFLRGFAPR